MDMLEVNKIYNADCLDFMRECPDNYFDLACVDPPYGIDILNQIDRKNPNDGHGWRKVEVKEWDNKIPTKEIFNEILRVSKNQIIWGGNYFADILPASQGWLVWNKGQRGFSLADGEMAWTSFDKAMRIFDYARAKQLNDEIRQHPTQKPVKLIEWCIDYSKLKEGSLILDCFSGSGTTAIAAFNKKMDFICIEKDYDYWKASVERLENAQAQCKLF